jgi:hypothetical protein
MFSKVPVYIETSGIDQFLIFPGKLSQLSRESKGKHIVLGRQLFVELIVNPLPILMVLAMRTISMTAGMGYIAMSSTIVISASGRHMRTMFFSTLFHGRQRFFMTGQDGGLIFVEKPLLKLFNN